MESIFGWVQPATYRLACWFVRRVCETQPAKAILLEYMIKDLRAKNPVSPELDESARRFFECVDETSNLLKGVNRV